MMYQWSLDNGQFKKTRVEHCPLIKQLMSTIYLLLMR